MHALLWSSTLTTPAWSIVNDLILFCPSYQSETVHAFERVESKYYVRHRKIRVRHVQFERCRYCWDRKHHHSYIPLVQLAQMFDTNTPPVQIQMLKRGWTALRLITHPCSEGIYTGSSYYSRVSYKTRRKDQHIDKYSLRTHNKNIYFRWW